MAFNHYKFYDSSGNNVTPVYKDGFYKLDIHFRSVSVGLFESEHLFIFEDVFQKIDPNLINVEQQQSYVEPLLIKILQRLDYDKTLKSYEDLIDLFIFDQLTVDEVDDFVNKNSAYIYREIELNVFKYGITDAGVDYLKTYTEHIQNDISLNLGLVQRLVKPRANFDLGIGEDSFFVYSWKQPETDKNIFVYLVDKNDPTKYFRENKAVCLDKGESFYSFVPVYDEFLKIDSISNPSWKNLFIPYRFDNGSNDTFLNNDVNQRRVLETTDTINYTPFQFNFALTGDREGFYERTLEIFYVRATKSNVYDSAEDVYKDIIVTNTYKFAEVTFHGEVVGEDERFRLLLENFGRKIDTDDTYVFRDADVEEDLPDYVLLNQKRKELLLEGDNIYPYLGNYRAFVNAIKYFGYTDLRLKEYFYNIETSVPYEGKIYYSSIEIPLDLSTNIEFDPTKSYNELKYKNLYTDDRWKKTSRFGLFYDLNEFTGDFDEYGFPIVHDVFQFTSEEVLIKLYGLKKALEKYFLPHTARIIDITGEGIYFAKYALNTWQNQNPIISLKFDNNPDFKATPLKGYLKHLDRLMNIFRIRDGVITEVLSQDYKIADIINRNLFEFSKDLNVAFEFQPEMPIETILQHYSSYDEIKKDIYRHVKESYCDDANNKEHLVAEYNQHKLLGQPIEIEYIPYDVKWKDLEGARWKDVEFLSPSCIVRGPGSDLIDVDMYRIENNLCGKDSIPELYTWASVGNFGGFEVTWIVEHVENKYCYEKTGLLKDNKKIMVFLPFTGFYDVTCKVRDSMNFQHITKKAMYIEVLKKQPNFQVLGRLMETGTWKDFVNKTWKEMENGSWIYGGKCPIETTWADVKDLKWSSLDYSIYDNQYFIKDEVKYLEVLDVNESDYKVTLYGQDFYNNYIETSGQKWRNNLIINKNPENLPVGKKLDIVSVDTNTVNILGLHDIKIGEKILIYKYKKTKDFTVKDNKIRIFEDDYEALEYGDMVRMIRESDALGYQEKEYIIQDVSIDKIAGFVDLIVDDDGSLDFKITSSDRKDLTYNYSRYNHVELESDHIIFKVLDVYQDAVENSTSITIYDPDMYMNYFSGLTLSDYKVNYEFLSGYYVFEIDETEPPVTSDGNTIVTFKPNSNICEITTTFTACYGDYDIDWAIKYANSRKFTWGNFSQMKWKDFKYITWNMLDYHSDPIMGFKIYNVQDGGKVLLNGTDMVTLDLGIMTSSDSDLDQMPYTKAYETWKWTKATQILNDSKLELFSKFEFKNINNRYIQALCKNPGKTKNLVKVDYQGGLSGHSDTYPRTNYTKYPTLYFKGENNVAMWNHLNRGLYENGDFNYINNDSVIPYIFNITGAFNFADTFVLSKESKVPKATTLFFIFNDGDFITETTQYKWELWEETTGKLLNRSPYKHMIWTFVDTGKYSIKLWINNATLEDYYIEKISFIEII